MLRLMNFKLYCMVASLLTYFERKDTVRPKYLAFKQVR